MDRAVSNSKPISAFDLDALREAFKKSVHENDVAPADWAEHAKLFIEQNCKPAPALSRSI